jgi:hypothetical protein
MFRNETIRVNDTDTITSLVTFMQAYCSLAPRNFLPSPREALCISQTQRTLLAKEETNGIWPAIS